MNPFIKKNSKSKKKKNAQKNQIKPYIVTLSVFVLSFFMVAISPAIMGESYDYEASKIGDIQTISQGIPIQLIKKEWNPESELLRLDFRIEASDRSYTVNNLQYELLNRYVTDPSKSLKSEIINVNSEYMVVLVSNLPEGFEVLGTGIKPSFIEPEIENDNGMNDRKLQYYFYEKDMKIDTKLVKESLNEYQIDWINLKQDEVKMQIKDGKKETRLAQVRIGTIEKAIQKIEKNKAFMTAEEIEEMDKNMLNYNKSIEEELEYISTQNENIKKYEDRIILYEEEIETLR